MSNLMQLPGVGQDFVTAVGLSGFTGDLDEFAGSEEHAVLSRYYKAASESERLSDQLAPAKLFQETLVSLIRQKAGPMTDALRKANANTKAHVARIEKTVAMLAEVQPSVPKNMHFVWVGGALFGDNQRDYFNIWKHVLSKEGHTLNLWYDPDALMAFDTNRIITQAAKAHAMESGGIELTRLKDLFALVERRVVVLRRQMFEHVKAAQRRGGNADEARIDLLVNAYGQDRATLEAARVRYLESHLAMAGEHVRIRDARATFGSHFLWDVYEREVSFRGNLAAASDVVRLQAQSLEGGTYSDLDYLPPLVEEMGGVDISKYSFNQKLGALQLLLNGNPALMPKRDKSRYESQVEAIPVEDREALVKFSESSPGVFDIFAAAKGLTVPQDGVRLGTALGGKEMNAFIMAHPESGMTHSIMQRIRSNYDLLLGVEQKIVNTGVHWDSGLAGEFAQEILQQESELTHRPLDYRNPNITKLFTAIGNYHRDGIYPQADGTILLTGPGAAIWGIDDFVQAHCTQDAMEELKGHLKLTTGYNRATEEETISGWVDNVTEHEEWVSKEQQNWRDGKYKARYTGNLAELLKEQTLTFKQGWPVIEGKPVLVTDVLQRLLDEQGERFIQAMNDKLSGDVTFDKSLVISFAERQQILAQTASELPTSDGAQPVGHLNEMFSRIEHGSLPLNQLSPLQRVVLGGLFGAQTLDDQGFGEAWKATRALASNTAERGLAARYEAIEKMLLKQKNAPFEAGFKTPSTFQGDAPSAQALKVLALTEPMSVRQWGEHVARTQKVAQDEYRFSILERGAAIRELFFQSGAVTAKQLPQDLLIHGEGDPGRRCYPLALVMAAALEKGDTAERALIGKLANANLAPEDSQSRALFLVLDELRGIPMATFGDKLGAVSLGSAMQILEGKNATHCLMLNTDTHSLLAAKVVSGTKIGYRFYDPNFGLYSFDRVQDLQQGIERFLSDQTLARLYGIDAASTQVFNLIALDGDAIAERTLPSQIAVNHLLRNEPVSGQGGVTPWEHHAKLRARSLSENARLGRGLLELEAQSWARQIKGSTVRLQEENRLGREFVPVFETLKATENGKSEIVLVNLKDSSQTRRVISEDSHLSRIKAHLTESFQTLSVKAPRAGVIDPTDVGAVHTLNAGFTVQALLMALKSHESLGQGGDAPALTSAVRWHGYLCYAQLAHGNLVDAVEVVSLVQRAIADSVLVSRTTSSVVGGALGHVLNEGVGTVLQLAAVGFDIYLLANAENEAQQAQFGTQLTFDVLSGASAIGAALVPAGAAAAFLGGASVILGGLAVGIGALVEGFNGILERARQAGQYLNSIEEAYRAGGYSVEGDVLYIKSHAVITSVDLRNRLIHFGSQEIFSAITNTLHPPAGNPDRSLAINIRQQLGLADTSAIKDIEEFDAIVLPCMPQCCFGFDYKALPFSTTRHEDFETALKLEYDSEGHRQFWFSFYKFPTEYILLDLVPNYSATTIRVLLDNANRYLHVPTLPKELQGYLSYEIEGSGGQCTLALVPGVQSIRLSQAPGTASMSWALSATWLSEKDVSIGDGRLQLGKMEVLVTDRAPLSLQVDKQSYQVDWERKILLIAELEVGEGASVEAVEQYLRERAHTHRLAGRYTAVHNFLIPFGDPSQPVHTTAWYDRSEDRFLYVRDLAPAYEKAVCLGAVIGSEAYFYVPDDVLIWRTDASTGRVNQIYRLMDPFSGSSISVFQVLEGGLIRIVQKVELRNGHHMKMIYLLGGNEVSLISITGTLTERQESLLQRKSATLGNFLWDYELFVKPSKLAPLETVNVVDYQGATFTAIHSLQAGRREPISIWVRRDDGLIIRPNVLESEGAGGAVSPVLLKPNTSGGETFLFYDQPDRSLYKQRIALQGMERATSAVKILPHDVVDVFSQERGHTALTREGLFYDLGDDGVAQLAGLTEDWLSDAKGSVGIGFEWWVEVLAVADKLASTSFAVLGLKNFAGDARLCVWCVDKRLLIADMGSDKVVRLLALTPDKRAAWLLDVSAGQVYRQPFIAPADLPAAFADDTRLLRRDLVPALQKIAPQWSFAQVVVHGAGLRGVTHERVSVELYDGEQPSIVGVASDFLYGQPSRKSQEEKLARLIVNQRHAPFLTAGKIGDLFTWYDATARRLFSSTVESNGQWPVYLGVRDQQTILLHDPVNRQLFSNRNGVWLAPDHDVWAIPSVVRREAQVLTIESHDHIDDLLPLIPDGVNTLVLGYGRGTMTCEVSLAAWLRLDCIIVDIAGAQRFQALKQSHLILQMEALDSWRVALVDGHLLLTEPDSGRSLIFHNVAVAGASSRRELKLIVHVFGSSLYLSLEDLLQGLGDENSLELAVLLDKSNEV